MRSSRWFHVAMKLLIGGLFLVPLPAQALTVTIDGRGVQLTNVAPCPSGYNLCRFIPPGTYGKFTVGDVSSTNKARILIGDNSTAGSLDLLKLTGITFTPVGVTAGTTTTTTATIVVTHTYNAGGGNPAGDYAWGYGMAGYLDPPSNENIVGDQLKQTGQGNFAGKIAALGLGLDTGRFATPSTLNLNGSVTRSRAATVVMPACNTGSNRCAPTITQTFTLTVVGADKLVLSDSLICAGGTCRPVDQVIPISPYLYQLMLKLDPNAPNDINQLGAWLAKMGEKYLRNDRQKKLLAYLIHELEKWLAKTVPGTCAEVQTAIDEIIEDDVEAHEAYIAILAALGELFAPAESGGTITLVKNTSQVTSDSFTFSISDGETTSTQTISMNESNSAFIVIPVEAGTYTITENPLSGWSFTGASCGVAGDPTSGVVVPLGGNVECTFTNTFSGTSGTFLFRGLGIPNGIARDVSSDGAVVVGDGAFFASQEAFRWTDATGSVNLTTGATGQSQAVSSDGSVVVGWWINPFESTGSHAFRWTTTGGLVDLGTLPSSGPGSTTSEATDVSADGNVVVGFSTYTHPIFGAVREAFRWTPADGMVGLGDLPGYAFFSSATAVSADSSVIVGWSIGASGLQEMFRWTSADGMQSLGSPTTGNPRPTAVSNDGTVIVGEIPNTGAFRWSEETGLFEILPGLGGSHGVGSAPDMSEDGSIIVGRAFSPTGAEAVIWRQVSGAWTVRTLKDVLVNDFSANGLTNWSLTAAEGISPDGRFIVGTGQFFGDRDAWEIQLP